MHEDQGAAAEERQPDAVREDIEKVTRVAGMAIGSFASRFRAPLALCTESDRVSVLVQATVTYLLGTNLVTVAPDEAFEQFLPMDLPEPYDGDIDKLLVEAAERKAKFDATAREYMARRQQ